MIFLFEHWIKKVESFKIIIYARLSKEEKNKQTKEEQSRSIKNQIEICRDYIENEKLEYPNCRFEIIEELYDDGVSGTTFNRNSFNKLKELIEEKKANMVVTKDLSRLGRDHVEADHYIEKWFPEHNIRYVAILDGVDTFVDTTNNDIAPIKNWANDMYAKDTSRKIKKEFKKMMLQGKWTGGEPPLGYQMDPYHKHHFIIEKKGAQIVKRIFQLAKANYSLDHIAKILMKEKVPIPTLMKKNKRKIKKELMDYWSVDTIRDILKNEIYLGHMVQGKTTKLNYKSKKIISLSKEDWIKVENTHEAIIDKETFETVQLFLKSNRNKTIKTYDYRLKGLLRCFECHHRIGVQHYKNRKHNYTICNYYKKYGTKKKLCTSHRFSYEKLEQVVLKSVQEDCFKYVNQKDIIPILQKKKKDKKQVKILDHIQSCEQEISKIQKQIDMIYEDKLNNIITTDQYQRATKGKEDMIEYHQLQLKRWKQQLKETQTKQNGIEQEDFLDHLLYSEHSSKFLLIKLIDVIYIHEDGSLDIHYKIQKPKS